MCVRRWQNLCLQSIFLPKKKEKFETRRKNFFRKFNQKSFCKKWKKIEKLFWFLSSSNLRGKNSFFLLFLFQFDIYRQRNVFISFEGEKKLNVIFFNIFTVFFNKNKNKKIQKYIFLKIFSKFPPLFFNFQYFIKLFLFTTTRNLKNN